VIRSKEYKHRRLNESERGGEKYAKKTVEIIVVI
jgi:hypothetical protein